MPPRRQLIVNADDFGFTRGVNDGILEAHHKGILTACTLMPNGRAFDHAAELAKAFPSLDVGCHLVLVQGVSVRDGRPLPESLGRLLRALALRRVPVHDELRAQIEKVLAAGLSPTHLDTHKHTHLVPPVLDAVARLSEEYRIRWVRRPFDFPLDTDGVSAGIRLVNRGLGCLRRRFLRVLSRHGCRTTDHFAGFQITGRLRTPELVSLIRQLPPGVTEFMCHPGFCTSELQSAATRLKKSREAELEALLAPEVADAVEAAGVELTNYRKLGGHDG